MVLFEFLASKVNCSSIAPIHIAGIPIKRRIPAGLFFRFRIMEPSGKADQLPPYSTMRKTAIIMAAMLLLNASCDQSHVRQAQTQVHAGESELDREIRRVMEKGINLEERQRQVPAIAAAFARRTDPQRARWLAALCYLKTLGTVFMPLDIAEIALVETGDFGLSGKAVSSRGALGVWQLMPSRAKSHGYSPSEMENDVKCAEAAVRELNTKLEMAKGNLVRAKKLYCGVGPQADAYEVKRRKVRKEILDDLANDPVKEAQISVLPGRS